MQVLERARGAAEANSWMRKHLDDMIKWVEDGHDNLSPRRREFGEREKESERVYCSQMINTGKGGIKTCDEDQSL